MLTTTCDKVLRLIAEAAHLLQIVGPNARHIKMPAARLAHSATYKTLCGYTQLMLEGDNRCMVVNPRQMRG